MLPNIKMDFRKEYKLIAQTPQIHFQASNTGAALRASEVKPKLDRYLIRRFTQAGTDYSKWLIPNQTKALDYKLRITPGEDKRNGMTLQARHSFDIFYGNTGASPDQKKELIYRDCTLEVICFYPELLETINSCIGDFFIVTNFGTMQSKGFGSYTVDGWDNTEQHIVNTLFEDSGSLYCYQFQGRYKDGEPDLNRTFAAIKAVYALMKSGINLGRGRYQRGMLTYYAHEYNGSEPGFGNEKAWLKQNKLAPALCKHAQNPRNSQEDYNTSDETIFYIRALLGVGDKLEFFKESLDPKDKAIVKVKCITADPEKKDSTDKPLPLIERFPSPVRFKVIDNIVYYIAYPLDERILDCEFQFTSEKYLNNKSMTLSTPTKEALGKNWQYVVEDFLLYCYEEFWEKDRAEYLKTFNDTNGIRISRWKNES